MSQQYFNAPSPSQGEFDELAQEVDTLSGKFAWKYLGHQENFNGSDAVTYPEDAVELFVEDGSQYVLSTLIPIQGTGTYYYGSTDTAVAGFNINRTTRKVYCYTHTNATKAYCNVYWR